MAGKFSIVHVPRPVSVGSDSTASAPQLTHDVKLGPWPAPCAAAPAFAQNPEPAPSLPAAATLRAAVA